MADRAPLLIFSDDYGRHPSSCQHLVNILMHDRPVLWVNTLGTRRPRLSLQDLRRGFGKLHRWASFKQSRARDERPVILNPMMWPTMSSRPARWINARLLARSINHAIGEHLDQLPIAITTVPIVADLPGRLNVRSWLYYCVDDYTTWPGLDHASLIPMEQKLLRAMDGVAAVSPALGQRLADAGHTPRLITHGVDLARWGCLPELIADHPILRQIQSLPGPHAIFWGLIDSKLDHTALANLSSRWPGSIILIGPTQGSMTELRRIPKLHLTGPLPHDLLPHAAALADLLLMPYIDHPALHASQPLKLMEYLATIKPVLCGDIAPARIWADCCRIASPSDFGAAAIDLLNHPPKPELLARRYQRLKSQSWLAKAGLMDQMLCELASTAPRTLTRQSPTPPDRKPDMKYSPRIESLTAPAPADQSAARPDRTVVLHARVVCGAGGGPDKTIARSAAFAPADRFDVQALCIHPDRDPGISRLIQQAYYHGMPMHVIGERGPIDLRTLRAAYDLCKKLNVSIWHAHDYKSNLLGLLLKPLLGLKLITTVHGWTDETARMRLYRKLDAWCLRRYPRVVAVSREIREECRRIGVPAQRLTLMRNGIDATDFQRRLPAPQAKRAMGIDPSHPTIGLVGRLSAEKGFDRILVPLAHVIRAVPNLRILVIGDGPEFASLLGQARGLGIAEHFRFLGWQNPIQNLYEAMDLLVMPSRTEGMPNVLLEAMAMEVPVLATAVGEVPHLLEHGQCGVLLSDHEDFWATTIKHLLADESMRTALAAAGLDRVRRDFNFADRMAHEFSLYDQLSGVQSAAGLSENPAAPAAPAAIPPINRTARKAA